MEMKVLFVSLYGTENKIKLQPYCQSPYILFFLHTQNQETGAYVWLDGWPDFYWNFDINGTIGGDGCIMMKDNSKWQDTTCSSSHTFICKQTDSK